MTDEQTLREALDCVSDGLTSVEERLEFAAALDRLVARIADLEDEADAGEKLIRRWETRIAELEGANVGEQRNIIRQRDARIAELEAELGTAYWQERAAKAEADLAAATAERDEAQKDLDDFREMWNIVSEERDALLDERDAHLGVNAKLIAEAEVRSADLAAATEALEEVEKLAFQPYPARWKDGLLIIEGIRTALARLKGERHDSA